MPSTTAPVDTARLFHALSDRTRLAVIDMLKDGERCVCEIQGELDATQSRLSFHLRVLKDAGLLLDRKEGRWNYYSLNADAVRELADAVDDLKPARRALPVRGARICCD
ncbi:MAG TPA: metalloregulator ArsR/SmtB family transcription factor [Gemmatimonadaceae bacterium]|nr:metalloregulator ArsR/SmtB family transcription factor [Gemmatimonadaceae bacterium]